MKTGIPWSAIRGKIRTEPWASDLAERLATAWQLHREAFAGDPPGGTTAWSHYYYCGKCAGPLAFDLASPEKHRCAGCDSIFSGEPWDSSWRSLAHSALLQHLERSAVLAQFHPERSCYREEFRRIVRFYVCHYPGFAIHDKHGRRATVMSSEGPGRLMAQSLDESIFLLSLLRYVSWGEHWFSPGEQSDMAGLLIEPAIDLIRPQLTRIHNIDCWRGAFLGAAAHFLGDRSLMRFSIEGEFGWRRQLEYGVREDGLWWEGSIHYHYYAFAALSSQAWALGDMGDGLWGEAKLKGMLDAPLVLVFPDGLLPAHNDSWPGQRLVDFANHYEIAQAFGISDYSGALAWMYGQEAPPWCCPSNLVVDPMPVRSGGFARCSIAALLFGGGLSEKPVPPSRQSRIFRASGIAILENENLRVGFRFHPHGGSHDHCDKLSVDVHAHGGLWSEDFGTGGYGAAVTNKWHRTAIAHNMLVVDEQRQAPNSPDLLCWDPAAGVAEAETRLAYPGVHLKRRISLEKDGWSDLTVADSESEHLFDWCFHGQGRIEGSLSWQPMGKIRGGPGYDQLDYIEQAPCDRECAVEWVLESGKLVRLTLSSDKPGTVYRARCPGNPGTKTVGIVIFRCLAKTVRLAGTFSLEPP